MWTSFVTFIDLYMDKINSFIQSFHFSISQIVISYQNDNSCASK